jgi:class 3 adenylate cyclase
MIEVRMDPTIDEMAFEEALAAIERARSWSPRVISRLEHHIRTAHEEELFRLDPLDWASERGVDQYEAVDLFLHGAKVGLLDMDWNVICPCCGKVMRSLRELHGLQAQNTCTVCFRRDRATLDDYVQVTFTISPSIRPIRFHRPETLSLDEYCFTYLYEPSARIAGMLTSRDALRMFQRHLSLFSPGERLTVETDAGPGILGCVDLFGQQSVGLLARGEPTDETRRIQVTLVDHGFEVSLPPMLPGEFDLGELSYAGTFYPIQPGPVAIEFEQRSTARAALAVIHFPVFGMPGDGATPEGLELLAGLDPATTPDVVFASPRLTAKRLFATQTFHELFRAEVFQESEGFGVKDVTILFTDLQGSTQMYQREGDLNAYALVREHYGILSQAVSAHHGAVIKTIGDAIMATFDRPVDAVAAGLEMLRELPRMNQSSVHGDLVLKVGVHHGAAISVTLNDRVDYFGQTVNIASRVQGSAAGGEMLLTEETFDADGVADLLDVSDHQVTSGRVPLRGIDEPLTIYRVAALDALAAHDIGASADAD